MVTSQPTPPHSASGVTYQHTRTKFTFDVPISKHYQPDNNVPKVSSPNPIIDSVKSNDSDKTLSGNFSRIDIVSLPKIKLKLWKYFIFNFVI